MSPRSSHTRRAPRGARPTTTLRGRACGDITRQRRDLRTAQSAHDDPILRDVGRPARAPARCPLWARYCAPTRVLAFRIETRVQFLDPIRACNRPRNVRGSETVTLYGAGRDP